jgi:MFS family permease
MNTGFFMLFPLLTVHLTRDLGFDATGVGLVLGGRNLLQQGLAPLGGSFSDRVGYKPIIVAGFGIRGAGFLLFALSHDVLGVVAGALVDASNRTGWPGCRGSAWASSLCSAQWASRCYGAMGASSGG